MKLLIIVLSLLSERYLIHAVSQHRFNWFGAYFQRVAGMLPKNEILQNSYFLLALVVLPPVLLLWLLLCLIGPWFFGFIGLLLNLFVFYYCIGPENPFYPVNTDPAHSDGDKTAGHYFYLVNSQLFAVIFWYIVAGPLGLLFYRLLTLSVNYQPIAQAAGLLVSILDWVTARVTVMLYLLVGNFQRGFIFYREHFLSAPNTNEQFLSDGGVFAAKLHDGDTVSLTNAQTLVEHALVVFLVLIAFFTLVAWL
ncbi:inner membrane protein AmpE [Legionella quinlivanii]|uniref:Inner membrane protein AmpE n=1 Tax=Legionella quinlivanii TaxID=45073 RepID=A0A0W0XV42_9GAMM|nr:hypothetical protein [Legionella quinlivanii]KTD48238.1 inner membrane protein AmpE [Legionella quinlivanii]SEF98067.1 AmpE protein [Legionella quinlivanii DSM 21216]STY11314.1 inner membrane protein AmpE [Legionella quinlivanii]